MWFAKTAAVFEPHAPLEPNEPNEPINKSAWENGAGWLTQTE